MGELRDDQLRLTIARPGPHRGTAIGRFAGALTEADGGTRLDGVVGPGPSSGLIERLMLAVMAVLTIVSIGCIISGNMTGLGISIAGLTMAGLILLATPQLREVVVAEDRDEFARLLAKALDAVEVPPPAGGDRTTRAAPWWPPTCP